MSLPRESLPSSDATPSTPPPAAAPSPEDPTALRPALKRDKLLAGLCLAALLVLHAVPGHLPGGVLLGLLLVLGATVGVLGLLGDSPLDLRGDERDAEADDDRPWYRREGVWVLLFGGLLYLPLAGAFGLWDPWETHYGEVAREIVARDDWITLWWAQEGWFMSKPILIFWMSALGMGFGSLFGLRFEAGAGPNLQEWFIRGPVCLLAIGAMFALYRAVAAAWGRRAGLLVALVLGTMPHWFFLAHQAMTDMPFGASLTIALAMFALAVIAPREALATPHRLRLGSVTLRVSLWHLTVGLVLVLALPQITYLLTRAVGVSCPSDAGVQCRQMLALNRVGGVQFPVELFYSGSAGNSGVGGAPSVPGSPPWERVAGAVAFFPSVLQGLVWTAVLLWALGGLRRERTREGLYFVLFYLWCAVSTMGKGPAGLAIPGAVAFLHHAATWRWADLKRIRLGVGLLVFLVVGMPWYVAITGRLGNEFIQRFVVHDIINRTVVGVHGDTGSVRYFIWQLGYAAFPWSGLVPVALAGWGAVVPPDATRAQRDVARIGLLWFVLAFVLFSAMITKFHHYIFPALPGAAVMVGLLLHRMLPTSAVHPEGARALRVNVAALAAQALGMAMLVWGVARALGSPSAIIPTTGPVAPSLPAGAVVATFGLGVVGLGAWWWRRAVGEAREGDDAGAVSAGLGALSLFAAGVVALVARDLTAVRSTPPAAERLIHLFVYNYDRVWPGAYLDFRPALAGFGAVAVGSLALLAVPAVRGYAVRGVLVAATLFAAWSLDVYMVQLTPHWSQRPLMEAYYARRRPRPASLPDRRFTHDPLVAHQMNWKGENFYTGNHLVAMECGLKYCTGSTAEWIRQHPGERAFFITEHSRAPALLTMIRGGGGTADTVTTEREGNKFVLVEATLGAGSPQR
jgi:4-amino-4-deoxy-L-arabinose transferase-like glycosyltransferase